MVTGTDLTEPQVLYKYGTSMYIDGGDEGTVSVFTETSDNKLLPSTGEYTSLFGVYPKSDIVSGGGDLIPNKKIIIPSRCQSLLMDLLKLVYLNVVVVLVVSSYIYQMADAGTFGETRKLMYKANINGTDSDLTLAPIEITASAAGTTNAVTTTDSDVQYLRSGDYLLDTDTGGTLIAGVVASRITAISENEKIHILLLSNLVITSHLLMQYTLTVFQPT